MRSRYLYPHTTLPLSSLSPTCHVLILPSGLIQIALSFLLTGYFPLISIESVVSAQVARSAFLKALRFPDAFNKEI